MTRDEIGSGTRRGEELVLAGDHEQGRSVLEGVLRKEPGAGRARFLLAYSYHKQKLYAQARPHFEAVLSAGPTFPRAFVVFYMYGWCLWYLGELDGAAAAFEATLEFDPDERDAHYGLALVALEAGRSADAEHHLRTSLALVEDLVEQADGDAKKIQQYKRDSAKARARLADVDLQQGRLEAAKENLEASLTDNPANYEAWFKLSRVFTRLGDPEKARRAAQLHDEWKKRAGR